MSDFPTPFIGGADNPSADNSGNREWAPPFAPDEADIPAPGPAPDAEPRAPAAPSADISEPSPTHEREPDQAASQTGQPPPAEDGEFPDFLMADPPGSPAQSEAAAYDEPWSESATTQSDASLDEVAKELLQGERGWLIRTLIADLEGSSLDEAISQAFAAGYLARAREGSD